MAVEKMTDALLFANQYALRSQSNRLSLEHGQDTIESTVFGNSEHRFISGNRTGKFSADMFFEANDIGTPQGIDKTLEDLKSQDGSAWTLAAKDGENNVSWIMQAVSGGYSWGGEVGAANKVQLYDMVPYYKFPIRSRIGMTGQKLAPFTGTGFELGALSATQRLYALLHINQFVGTTLTVKIQSDDNAGFTTPVDQVTFTAATGVTYEWKELAGPITDTYWRVLTTFTGTSYTGLCSFGRA